jgi:phosphoribosylamine--glycine ligase
MLYMLNRWKKEYPTNGKLIIQKFIPGIEFAVGGWFGPAGFKQGYLEGFEFKKLMAGDIGVNTGEMGSVLQYVKKSKLAEEMLLPLVDELHKVGHVGYVDVAVIVDEKGQPWPLEFTMRPGYPTVNIWQELHEGDCADWMLEMLEGESPENVLLDTVAVGVCLAIPDFPYSDRDPKEACGVPIFGAEMPLSKHFHPSEVRAGEQTDFETAGSYVAICTGTAETVKRAAENAYKEVDKIVLPAGMLYRNDIGAKLKKQLPKLQKFGYGMEFKYE